MSVEYKGNLYNASQEPEKNWCFVDSGGKAKHCIIRCTIVCGTQCGVVNGKRNDITDEEL